MKYENITSATFLSRPNRFIAEVEINGACEVVHVKNTGRCKELLLPGCEVWLTAPASSGRKTKYDLVAVKKSNGLLINIDSQAPNKVALEWLRSQGYENIRPEYSYGDSRIDFYMEKNGEKYLMEVKGCTLEIDGVGFFPDAPTERGVKHIHELIRAKSDGYRPILCFVIQMDGITEVRPNISMHPEFGIAMDEAKKEGVEILFLPCHVEPDLLEAKSSVFPADPLIQQAIGYITGLFRENADGHDLDHTLRVYRTAMKISEKYKKCDKKIVALASLLHDADDPKLFHTGNNGNARKFLSSHKVSKKETDAICRVINSVSFSHNKDKAPSSIEEKIVQDSDRLDAMGAIGIARTFAYGGKHDRSLDDSVRHFYEKLLLLYDLLNTDEAKKIGRKRALFLKEFLREYKEETE